MTVPSSLPQTAIFKVFTHLHRLHLPLNREGPRSTTSDFATSFLHFSLFSIALWDLANSGPIQSLTFSSHLFFCLPCSSTKSNKIYLLWFLLSSVRRLKKLEKDKYANEQISEDSQDMKKMQVWFIYLVLRYGDFHKV